MSTFYFNLFKFVIINTQTFNYIKKEKLSETSGNTIRHFTWEIIDTANTKLLSWKTLILFPDKHRNIQSDKDEMQQSSSYLR